MSKAVKPDQQLREGVPRGCEPADFLFHISSQRATEKGTRGRHQAICPKKERRKLARPLFSKFINEFYLIPPKRNQSRKCLDFADLVKRRRTRYQAFCDLTWRDFSFYLRSLMAVSKGPFNGLDHRKLSYPSGGGVYESLVLFTVQRMEGLPAGRYYYDDQKHKVGLLSSILDVPISLLTYPVFATAVHLSKKPKIPQIQIFILADLGRLSWAYRKIAYRTALTNASILMYHGLLCAEYFGFSAAPMGCYPADVLSQFIGKPEHKYPLMTQYCLFGRSRGS